METERLNSLIPWYTKDSFDRDLAFREVAFSKKSYVNKDFYTICKINKYWNLFLKIYFKAYDLNFAEKIF